MSTNEMTYYGDPYCPIEVAAAGYEAGQADRDMMRQWLSENGTYASVKPLRAYRSAAERVFDSYMIPEGCA